MTDRLDALLERLRADVPPMSDDAFDAGRAVLAAAVVVTRDDAVEPADQPPVIRDARGLSALPPRPVNAARSLAAAVSESELTIPPGQYVYFRVDVESRMPNGGPVMKRINENWLPAEPGQEMMVRDTEPGSLPQEHRSTRVDYVGEQPLEATPAAQYQAMRVRLGTALDAAEQARDELLMPLTHPLMRPEERKLRFATIALLPKTEVREERLADGRAATVIRAVDYGGASHTDVYFDPATGHVIEVRTVDLANPPNGGESVVRYGKPVVVPSIGAVP